MDDVMFAQNRTIVEHVDQIPLPWVTSLRRHTQAMGPLMRRIGCASCTIALYCLCVTWCVQKAPPRLDEDDLADQKKMAEEEKLLELVNIIYVCFD